jgi:hypothetical protein
LPRCLLYYEENIRNLHVLGVSSLKFAYPEPTFIVLESSCIISSS